MKCINKITAFFMCLALVLVGMAFSGCGKSKSGGGESTTGTTWYQDSDGDGFGNAANTQVALSKPEGYVDNSGDCNDGNLEINPGAIEINDEIDNNCDGEKDEDPKAGIIPDTAQVGEYSDTFGEDSDYLIDPPSYSKLDENGQVLPDDAVSWKMIKDNVTGLIWEMKSVSDGIPNSKNIHDVDNLYTWDSIKTDFIDKLNETNFGNFSDSYTWRLPSIKELASLADCSKTSVRISTKYFGDISLLWAWSSTPFYEPDTKAWYMQLRNGVSYYSAKTEKYGVLAVRGKEAVPELESYHSNMIKDKTTGLIWQKATGKTDDGENMTFEAALAYCENLELGGFKDWRLPSRNEMITLLSLEQASPTIESGFFTDMKSGRFWTSSTFLTSASTSGDFSLAWIIDFSSGVVTYNEKTKASWVRAVRGGNNATLIRWHLDKDDDGYGDSAAFKLINSTVSGTDGYVLDSRDCNDESDEISPAAVDIPDDGIDQNCTGKDTLTWYKDDDGDGFGNKTIFIISETKPENYIHDSDDINANHFDCNDANLSINPDMSELVDDGIDNDCNGFESVSWYLDADNDGHGTGLRVFVGENPPDGVIYASNDLDCDDSNPNIHPGLVEILGNLSDSNCNGYIHDDAQRIIPDTGQISSYTSTPGEDGDYLINPPSFSKFDVNGNEVLGDGEWVTIRDNVTGLYWEVKTVTNKNAAYTFSGAGEYTANLVLGGFSDWRLPSVTELATITNLEKSNPAAYDTYFPNMVSNKYWTHTDMGSGAEAFTVSFQRGATYFENKNNYYIVIAVRGGLSLADRLVANADGTVTDTETGLMWNDLLTTYGNWDDSVAYWTTDSSAGYNDWRLPSESDVATLLDIIAQDSDFDFSAFFENVTFTGSFWTTTLAATDTEKAIVFSFITGETDEMTLIQVLKGLGVRGINQGRFTVNEDGTVLDTKTGLMWMRENTNEGLDMTFESALNVCDTLTFANYNDWRMPNRNELISLLNAYIEDRDGYLKAFPNSETLYWSSSSCSEMTGFAWQVGFATGGIEISSGKYTNENVFRAVRGGNPE